MATGKTNVVYMRAYFDGVDLSGDARGFGTIGSEYDEIDVTGWSEDVVYYQLGQVRPVFDGFQAVFNNTASTGSYTELSAREEYLISVHFGIRTAPAIGDPAWGSVMNQKNMKMDGSGPLLLTAELNAPAGSSDSLMERVWGNVVGTATSQTTTYTGSSINNGASSSDGSYGLLHVLSADGGGTWTFKIRHSTNDADWSDLISFSADGQSVLAEQGSTSSTVNQYVRFEGTAGGSNTGVDFVVTFIRR